MLVLWCKGLSCESLCLTICMDGSTGTDVNRALTSNDVITSPSSSFLGGCWTKWCVFLRWWGDWPTRVWWCTLAPLPHHMLWIPYWTLWAWGGANFVDFGKALNLGGTALVGYSFLSFWSLSPPVCFMSLSVCISLFFILVVGSLLRTLYVLVSSKMPKLCWCSLVYPW